jgi:hypothetical protein
VLLALSGKSLASEPQAAIRVGDHDGFGRIVLDSDASATLHAIRDGDDVTVPLSGLAPVPPARMPRNVRAIAVSGGALHIVLAPGSTLRQMVINRHLVLDALDPSRPASARPAEPARPPSSKVAANPPSPPAGKPPTRPPAAVSIAHADPAPPSAAPVLLPTAQAAPQPAPPSPAPPPTPPLAPTPGDASLRATSAQVGEVPAAGPGHLLAIPFGPQVGAAAFRHGDEGWVVFDERKPIDLAAVQDDPVFGHATVLELPDATLLRIALPAGAELRLSRDRSGWQITAIGGDAMPRALQSFESELVGGAMHILARQPGLVVSAPDPDTGGVLLIGTQRVDGQGLALSRRLPDLVLRPSWQGVVAAPLSDALSLRATPDGFDIAEDGGGGGRGGLAMTPPGPAQQQEAASSKLTRAFDLPHETAPSLLLRLQAAMRSAAAAPEQSKAEARRGVAEAMLAMGLGVEAQSVLNLAATADARALDDPHSLGLSGVAAILADRPQEAGGLDDKRLDGIDEIALWRAIRDASLGRAVEADALVFKTMLPLVESYPHTMQRKILPIVADALVAGGQTEAAETLLSRHAPTPRLQLAQARLQRDEGHVDDALKLYDRIAQSNDRLARADAAREAVDLRLAQGRLGPAEAAQHLGKLLYAWRGDSRELDLRLHAADVLGQANQWRQALQLLRETDALWPDQHDRLHALLAATLARALQPGMEQKLSDFDAVALAEENADLVPDGPAGLAFAEMISDRLMALDLPDRETGFLERMVAGAPPGVGRAKFGARLARARMLAGQPQQAIAALAATSAPELTPELLEERGLIFADAMAAQGDFPSARQALIELDTASADRKRGELAEKAKNWPEAEAAWQRALQRAAPASGPLDAETEQILVRLASAAALAKDAQMLARLRADYLPRMAKGRNSALLDFLASGGSASPADLGIAPPPPTAAAGG